jgi:1,4-dihydroxy-2-naphthoate octaprenyltransferase
MTRWLRGVWRLADPTVSLASFASICLAAAVARRDGPLAAGWLLLTVLGVFAIEVATNVSGEIVDFASGVDLAVTERDRSPFSGGKRVLVDRLLTRAETAFIAAAFYGWGSASASTIVPAQRQTLLSFVLLAVGSGLGLQVW